MTMEIVSNNIRCLYFLDVTTFYILGQKFVKFFVVFLENLRHQKDILRLTDLYVFQLFVGNKNLNCFNEKFLTVCDTLFPFLSSKYKE